MRVLPDEIDDRVDAVPSLVGVQADRGVDIVGNGGNLTSGDRGCPVAADDDHRGHPGGTRLGDRGVGRPEPLVVHVAVTVEPAGFDGGLGVDRLLRHAASVLDPREQRLTLGDTTLTLYLTPGHTPGTISTLIPVKDQGRAHIAAEWGGTGFNFTVTPDKPRSFWFEQYSKSAEHFRDAVTKAGADVLIANHPSQDGAKTKLAALAKRRPGDAHPFVVGNDSVSRYVTMVGECAKAGLLR